MKFPDSDPQTSTSRQFWLLRELESEITLAMYYPSSPPGDVSWNVSFGSWFTHIHERLHEWHQTTHQSINFGEKIEFHEILFQCQILRLNRPSPRCPRPTRDMRKRALISSIALIKEFDVVDRVGKLFNIWHAAHYIVESGACLLATVVNGMDTQSPKSTHLEGEEVAILTKYIQKFPCLLWNISRRWPDIAQHASALEPISNAVLEKLSLWSSGETIRSLDLVALKEELSQNLSLFSPLPLRVEASHSDNMETTGVHFQSGHPTGPLPSGSRHSLELSDYPLSTIEAGPVESSWADFQPAMGVFDSTFPDPYVFDGGDALVWDFAGTDSDEILAALFDEGDPLMLNDGTGTR
ncbi:hypothetical protein A1O1_08764 [Capronia coronata CBS 617.96]|uniref:Transcription factor domain-containing protein n=1 Tax=Capronia coronata CBS 617.96 TaxID=1182541 RepID=W9XQA3_9EURO|nr:uncharacterized protein A1O1_08764 [Capronia coronata CBS 617.96]EXJ79500.1 hypothetical protein A1O1_08764 [Capronia coronata CBS 617.96]